jgi:hypothetical protein
MPLDPLRGGSSFHGAVPHSPGTHGVWWDKLSARNEQADNRNDHQKSGHERIFGCVAHRVVDRPVRIIVRHVLLRPDSFEQRSRIRPVPYTWGLRASRWHRELKIKFDVTLGAELADEAATAEAIVSVLRERIRS